MIFSFILFLFFVSYYIIIFPLYLFKIHSLFLIEIKIQADDCNGTVYSGQNKRIELNRIRESTIGLAKYENIKI